jgi:cell division protein FtsI (penicillin-binding protein 3)
VTIALAPDARRVRTPAKTDALALTYHRLMLMMLVFAGITLLIVGRLVFLQIFTERAVTASGNPLLPARADLVDRNGIALARTIDAWSIGVHPRKLLGDPDDLAVKLAELIPGRTPAQYKALLTQDKNFVYLARRALPELVAAVNALGEPAIAFAQEPERVYPQTQLAGHILGWTDLDGNGVAGMEKVLEKQLRADPGKPIALSIDSRVQAAMESELGAAVLKHSAEGATGIVLDAHTGEIISLASFPTFNPNAAGKSPIDAQFNRATMGVYELGSVFKPITVAAAMEAGVVKSVAQRYPSGAPVMIGRFRIKDDHPIPGSANIVQTLVESSNIVSAQIADQMGAQRMQAHFRALGFHQRAHIELPEKALPLFPAGEWSRATVLTSGFGHGVAISPLHLASAYAALVNGGVWRPTTLMKRPKVPAGRRVYSEETSYKIRQMLRMIVLEGTGKKAEAVGYRVGGKTGTAEKVAAGGGYSRRVNVSTFASAFPMDDPKYVVVVMMDAPKGTKDTFGFTTAGWTAAPVVSKVIARSGPILGVMPSDTRDVDTTQMMALLGKPKDH